MMDSLSTELYLNSSFKAGIPRVQVLVALDTLSLVKLEATDRNILLVLSRWPMLVEIPGEVNFL